MKLFFSLLFILIGNFIFSQNWLFLQGDDSIDEGRGIVIDSKGYIYVIGTFEGAVDFDPGTGVDVYQSVQLNDDNCFIQKFHPDQTLVWLKTFGIGQGSINEIEDVIIDADDNIYIAGSFTGSMNFGTGTSYSLSSQNSSDGFVAKYNEDGNIIWAKGVEGYDIQSVQGIAVDVNNNVYLTGSYRDGVDLDPGAGVAIEPVSPSIQFQGFNGFIAKWNSDGNFIWGDSYQAQNSGGQIIEVDDNGNIYLIGGFKGDLDIDISTGTQLHSRTNTSMFVVKMDSFKNFIWGKVMDGVNNGPNYQTSAYAASLDYNGNLFIGGSYAGEAYFGYGDVAYSFVSNDTYVDAFIQKLDIDGNHLWTKVFGAEYPDHVFDLIASPNGQLYATGSFVDTVVFNSDDVSSTVVSQSMDVFAMSWGLDGSFNWVETFGGTCDVSHGKAIAHDGNQNVYGTGMFRGSLEPAPSTYIFGYGEEDCIVFKIGGQLDISESELETSFTVFPNPTKDILNIKLNTEDNPDRIEVIDLTGRLVISNKFNNQLSLELLEAGTYMLRIWKGYELYGTKKIILD